MNRGHIITGCVLLFIVGFALADSISSSIVCDGATFVSSSVLGQGQMYAARLFTTDFAHLIRDITVTDAGEVKTGTKADSAGPIGVDEYSGMYSRMVTGNYQCLFDESGNRTRDHDRIMVMGLMEGGEYSSERSLDPESINAVTMANGTGMVLVRAKSGDGCNETSHGSDVSGRFNMTEYISFGGPD